MFEWIARLLKSPIPTLIDLLCNLWSLLFGILIPGLIWVLHRLGLWKRCAKQSLKHWIHQLDHDDEPKRLKARRKLIDCGHQAVHPLVESLKKTDSDTRRKLVVEVLCEIGAPALKQLFMLRKEGNIARLVDEALEKCLPEVVEHRQHEREYAPAWKRAWNRLRHPEQITDRLIALLDEDGPVVQEGAALALGQYPQTEVVRILGQKLYECKNSEVRKMVAQSLGQTELPQAVPYLIIGLTDRSSNVRLAVCQAIRQISDWKAVFALGGTLLLDEHREVQIAAARALGYTEDKEAMRVLEKALEMWSDDDDHRELRQIVGEESAQLQLKLSGRGI